MKTHALRRESIDATHPLLDLGSAADDLGRREFAVHHALAGHPLFSLDAILDH